MTRAALVSVVMCLLLSCGGTEPNPGDGDPDPDPDPVNPGEVVGLWDAALTGIGDLHGDNPVPGDCTAEWVMSIVEESQGSETLLSMTIPFTARFHCPGGQAIPWFEGSRRFVVTRDSDSVAFFDQRSDSFMVARFSGRSTLEGHSAGNYYPAASFRAERRLDPVDPNLAPYHMEILTQLDSLEVGENTAVSVYSLNAYGQEVLDSDVEWSSSDSDIATVSPEGMVVAVAPGAAIIRGALGVLTDTMTLQVRTPPAAIEIAEVPDSVIVPGNHALVGVARDGGGQVLPGRRFHWTSSDPASATVVEFGSEGWLTAVRAGTVTITARSVTLTASVDITVLAGVSEIVVTGTDGTVPIGGTVELTATTRDGEGNVLTGRPVSWQADLPDWMSVDQNGRVTGHQGGPSVITVRSESVVKTLNLTATMDTPLADVSAGQRHTCGLTETGKVYCWGYSGEGQLGPDFVERGATAVPVPTGQTFASLSAGAFHTCALNQVDRAFCWGANGSGELGHDPAVVGEVGPVTGGLAFTSLALGNGFSCALTATRDAYCWGKNTAGQLGRGGSDDAAHLAPEPVTGGRKFTEIRAGSGHACGLTAAGEAYCWGANWRGMLGLGTVDDAPHPTPVRAAPGLTFTSLTAGSVGTCGISTDGPVYCWGDAWLDPTQIDASSGYVRLAAGSQHYCRLDTGGAMSCWGTSEEFHNYNLDQEPSQPIRDFAAGLHYTCALPTSGKASCWGLNDFWQLGARDEFGSGPVEVWGQP